MQTLLASIGLCQPQPKVPSELIRFLGKTYCAWHNATWTLEQHVMIFPSDPRCFDALVGPSDSAAVQALAADMHQHTIARDVRTFCNTAIKHIIMSCQHHICHLQ